MDFYQSRCRDANDFMSSLPKYDRYSEEKELNNSANKEVIIYIFELFLHSIRFLNLTKILKKSKNKMTNFLFSTKGLLYIVCQFLKRT
jgi:hypothetical protein